MKTVLPNDIWGPLFLLISGKTHSEPSLGFTQGNAGPSLWLALWCRGSAGQTLLFSGINKWAAMGLGGTSWAEKGWAGRRIHPPNCRGESADKANSFRVVWAFYAFPVMTECTRGAKELTPEQWRGMYPPDTSVPQGKALPFLFPQERGQTSVSPEKELDDFISPEPFPQRKRPGSPVILSLLLRFLCGNCRENRSAEQ